MVVNTIFLFIYFQFLYFLVFNIFNFFFFKLLQKKTTKSAIQSVRKRTVVGVLAPIVVYPANTSSTMIAACPAVMWCRDYTKPTIASARCATKNATRFVTDLVLSTVNCASTCVMVHPAPGSARSPSITTPANAYHVTRTA